MFLPVEQGGLGLQKMKQLFELDVEIIDANHFKILLNNVNDQTFLNNALRFVKVQ